ncbi:hypothetical protein E2C01_006901 [Portunus trituberculatus]|uniref:Uncharacterized protein n=1 Tax=Portunus trituberculatus TaxID=210409 RepID=A0A5B7D317_PORTR|nr:hypothetical protein [Portunus trituberculatus]
MSHFSSFHGRLALLVVPCIIPESLAAGVTVISITFQLRARRTDIFDGSNSCSSVSQRSFLSVMASSILLSGLLSMLTQTSFDNCNKKGTNCRKEQQPLNILTDESVNADVEKCVTFMSRKQSAFLMVPVASTLGQRSLAVPITMAGNNNLQFQPSEKLSHRMI